MKTAFHLRLWWRTRPDTCELILLLLLDHNHRLTWFFILRWYLQKNISIIFLFHVGYGKAGWFIRHKFTNTSIVSSIDSHHNMTLNKTNCDWLLYMSYVSRCMEHLNYISQNSTHHMLTCTDIMCTIKTVVYTSRAPPVGGRSRDVRVILTLLSDGLPHFIFMWIICQCLLCSYSP